VDWLGIFVDFNCFLEISEMDSEEDDEDFMDEDDDEKPDITPVENDSKIREIIDKICDLED